MKINEKNLCTFATSTNYAPDKEGWLMKKGDMNKGFQKRWFVLKRNLLFYFEKRTDKEPLGVIILEGCTIELDENDVQFSFKIVFHGMGNRSYVLCAENQEAMEQWMKNLACASYDYMKLMVTDLQRQLKETHCSKIPDQMTPTSDILADSIGNASVSTTDHGNGTSSHTHFESGNPSPHPPPRSKHKITFKYVHAVFGRPVLRSRNEWRYRKRDAENQKSVIQPSDKSITNPPTPITREQNLLISL